MSINSVTPANVDDWLDYHAPTHQQTEELQAVREAAKVFAKAILFNCVDCADRSYALRMLKVSLMSANQSIILEDK